jgi:hypothetical protein
MRGWLEFHKQGCVFFARVLAPLNPTWLLREIPLSLQKMFTSLRRPTDEAGNSKTPFQYLSLVLRMLFIPQEPIEGVGCASDGPI